ncbi:MAG: hypothetical protein IJY24_07545, partial [Clostridia bacterium]|nr:hypothetical protein [Clostridia bacterium]
ETLTAEQFNEVAATVSTAANDVLENYAEGSMGVGSFDTWAYGDDLKVGSYNTTPIKLGESAHVVMLYTGEGEETWKVTVKDAILDEKIQANYETMLTKYAPVSYPKAMAKTKGVNG